jgi:hypothetical protein
VRLGVAAVLYSQTAQGEKRGWWEADPKEDQENKKIRENINNLRETKVCKL